MGVNSVIAAAMLGVFAGDIHQHHHRPINLIVHVVQNNEIKAPQRAKGTVNRIMIEIYVAFILSRQSRQNSIFKLRSFQEELIKVFVRLEHYS